MKRTGNKNLKIIAATAMTIFSLFATFSATFAWFISNRKEDNTADNFEVRQANTAVRTIEIHKYLGESTDGYFAFDPETYATFGMVDGQMKKLTGESSITLDVYSLSDPHHPVLLLFQVAGSRQTINVKTDYPYLAQDKPGPDTNEWRATHVYSTYSALTSAYNTLVEGGSDFTVDEYFEITSDENQNGLDKLGNHVSSRYQYKGNGNFERVWVDLAVENNPLSSIARTYSFTFTSMLPTTTKSVYLYNNVGVRDDEPTANTSCKVLSKSDCTSDSGKTFAQFTDANYTGFESEYNVYDGSIDGCLYVGVVIDYNPMALEHLFSYYLGNEKLSYDLTFSCDWKTLF